MTSPKAESPSAIRADENQQLHSGIVFFLQFQALNSSNWKDLHCRSVAKDCNEEQCMEQLAHDLDFWRNHKLGCKFRITRRVIVETVVQCD